MIIMLNLKFKGHEEVYPVSYTIISDHVVQITGECPALTDGFTLSRQGKDDGWDYIAFTTVYRQMDGAVQYSDDGSVYVPPKPPAPPTPPEPPTLQELQEQKVSEMNAMQQAAIAAGVDVTLTDGSTEHFTLTDHDQISLMGLQGQVAEGIGQIPWHTSDEGKACKFYSNADMALITAAAMAWVTWHVTYYRDLRIYIRALEDKEAVEAVTYGQDIPEEYQSDVLKALIAERQKLEEEMRDA